MQTEQEQLEYINKECNTNYTSLDEVDWIQISIQQKLSENFIREFKDKLDWYWISKHQKLSESFIREFQDKLDWVEISQNQRFSKEFATQFQDKLEWLYVIPRQMFDFDFLINTIPITDSITRTLSQYYTSKFTEMLINYRTKQIFKSMELDSDIMLFKTIYKLK